jgi:hypothetical protein
MYRSPNIIRILKSIRIRWAGHVAIMEEGRSSLKKFIGKLTRRIFIGRPGRRWVENVRMDLKEIGFSTRNWLDSAQDRDY